MNIKSRDTKLKIALFFSILKHFFPILMRTKIFLKRDERKHESFKFGYTKFPSLRLGLV